MLYLIQSNCRLLLKLLHLLAACCTSLTSDFLWSHWYSNRKLILFHWTWFLPHSTILWLQRDELIQQRKAAEAQRDSWLAVRIGVVQSQSVHSALDLLHKKYTLRTKQLKQATLRSKTLLIHVSFVPACQIYTSSLFWCFWMFTVLFSLLCVVKIVSQKGTEKFTLSSHQ